MLPIIISTLILSLPKIKSSNLTPHLYEALSRKNQCQMIVKPKLFLNPRGNRVVNPRCLWRLPFRVKEDFLRKVISRKSRDIKFAWCFQMLSTWNLPFLEDFVLTFNVLIMRCFDRDNSREKNSFRVLTHSTILLVIVISLLSNNSNLHLLWVWITIVEPFMRLRRSRGLSVLQHLLSLFICQLFVLMTIGLVSRRETRFRFKATRETHNCGHPSPSC